jgi:hypothetical protein
MNFDGTSFLALGGGGGSGVTSITTLDGSLVGGPITNTGDLSVSPALTNQITNNSGSITLLQTKTQNQSASSVNTVFTGHLYQNSPDTIRKYHIYESKSGTNTVLGQQLFHARDNSNIERHAASIEVIGSSAAFGSTPCDMIFKISQGGTPNTRLRIDSDGILYATGDVNSTNFVTPSSNLNSVAVSASNNFSAISNLQTKTQYITTTLNTTEFNSDILPTMVPFGNVGSAAKPWNIGYIREIDSLNRINRYWTPFGGFYQAMSNSNIVTLGNVVDFIPLVGKQPFYNGAVGAVVTFESFTLTTGDSYHMLFAGHIPTASNLDTLTIRFYLNAVLFTTLAVEMENMTDSYYELEADFVIRENFTHEIITNAEMTFNKQPAFDFKGTRIMTTAPIDVGIVNLLTVTAQFSGTSLSSQIITKICTMRRTY